MIKSIYYECKIKEIHKYNLETTKSKNNDTYENK